jgi:hypothetical protein
MKILKPGTICSVDEPETFGVLPIRTEIEILPADKPNRPTIGWTCEIIEDEPIIIIENNERLSLDNFKVGLKVRVLTLIGTLEMTTGLEFDSENNSIGRYAETEKSITFLDTTKDGFLVSTMLINKAAFYFI